MVCETPNLYRAEITLVRDGKVIDNVTEKFGIRTLEYSPEFGFKLNGKKLFLKGIANHHDLGAVGAAAFDRAIERQFELLKKFGYNHVRTSHNPYSKSFMELADKHGILIVDELIDKWSDKSYWGGRVPFTQLWYKMIPNGLSATETILRLLCGVSATNCRCGKIWLDFLPAMGCYDLSNFRCACKAIRFYPKDNGGYVSIEGWCHQQKRCGFQ